MKNRHKARARKQSRREAVDPVKLDALLGKPTINEIQAQLAAAQRAERMAALEAAQYRHEFDDDACCIHCGFDGAEWSHWKKNTHEGRASDEKQPLCTHRQAGASRTN